MTPKRQRFVQEYLKDLNATQAAIRAGYSARTAKQQGARLLTNADVMAAAEAAKQRVADRIDVTVEEIVTGLYTEATRTGQGSQHSARVAAWAHLGKYRGMFIDKLEHQVSGEVLFRLPKNGRDGR